MGIRVKSMFVFFCQGDSILSRMIIRICGWSHMGLGFHFEEASEPALCYEALFARGVRKTPLSNVKAWAQETPGRKLHIFHLPLPSYICERKLGVAQTFMGMAGYAEVQLLAMWFFERIGRAMRMHVPKSTRQVVCSEFVARVLSPDLDLRDSVRTRFDEVTPGSAYAVMTKRWRAEEGITIEFFKA